jgi:thiosulfate/3-mercaptopyruvate sulfurtransferase
LTFVIRTLENKDGSNTAILFDVRSPIDSTGEILFPLDYPPEHTQRREHISGAKNMSYSQAVSNNDGTSNSADELKKLYESKGIAADKEVIAYSRIGERSSHSWFVLKYLPGYPKVKNYDCID